ncbi:thioredoxin-interacting protein-like isoform X1 [Synchiropus splendidus]|uniref:thioredoxin-interacting protein-like isoform X1 n=1 Tax=Synchiropus splendidus TaxID=270530 RepID=UPI00237D48AF|nr:thioredoxin-interacting protein-like isoform X1 [Synchiropus splendidus]
MVQSNKPEVFQVNLSSPGRPSYRSGDKFSGSVLLAADKPCRFAGLTVTAVGVARVKHRGRKRRRQEKEHLNHREDVPLEAQLERDGAGCFLLPAGRTFSFCFSFLLPRGLVSSFKSKLGCVHYCVKATLRRPSQADLQCERDFEVEELLDVNRQDLQAPVYVSTKKALTCMFIPEGQVSISAGVDRMGYCIGEMVHIQAKFENRCSCLVVPKAAICAKHSFIADGHTKTHLKKLTVARGEVIVSGSDVEWQGIALKIPQVKPTLQHCDIIKVEYVLQVLLCPQVYLAIPGRKKVVVELPLVLGNVPSRGKSCTVNGPMGSCCSFLTESPSYGTIGVDTPLLEDCDNEGEEVGLIMRAPASSPALLCNTTVRCLYGNRRLLQDQ